MTWAIEWSRIALRDFFAVPSWETAARIDGALMRLASTGEGDIRHAVAADGSAATRLLVPPYAALVTRDRRRRVITVWRVLRYA
jgi:hypothetical protein